MNYPIKGLFLSAGALVLLSCGSTEPTQLAPNLSISFPAEANTSTLPFEPGGKFTVRIAADIPKLCGPTHAQVDIVTTSLPPGAIGSALVTLVPQEPCAKHAGDAILAWPTGGAVKLRAALGGTVLEQEAPLEVPRLDLQFGARSRVGTQLKFPVCIESSSTGGTLDVRLTKAVSGSSQDSFSVPLSSGGCEPTLLEADRRSRARFDVFTTEAQFQLSATLAGTSATISKAMPVLEGPGTFGVEVTSPVNTLPEGPSVVEVAATATLNGVPTQGIPVRFESVPVTQILPPSAVTDESGQVRVQMLIPAKFNAVHVDAIVGDVRDGITLAKTP